MLDRGRHSVADRRAVILTAVSVVAGAINTLVGG
jgi:hypothetical protein